MKENGRVTTYDMLQQRQNMIRPLVTEYMSGLQNPKIRTVWMKASQTRPRVITATSLVLTARTHEDLNFLILKELYRHKTPYYQNSSRIFSDDPPNPEKLADYAASPMEYYEESLRGTRGYKPDRGEEIAVGQDLFQRLVSFSCADQNLGIRQTETARLLAQFSIAAEGQASQTHQNLKYRLSLASFLVGVAMGVRSRIPDPQDSPVIQAPVVSRRV